METCRGRNISVKYKKVLSEIAARKRIRPLILNRDTSVKIHKAFIKSHFVYCSSVWDGLNKKSNDKSQKLQKLSRNQLCNELKNTH